MKLKRKTSGLVIHKGLRQLKGVQCFKLEGIRKGDQAIPSKMVYLSSRPHFLWVYRGDNPRGMLGEHEKSLKITSRRRVITSFPSVLPTSQVGYHAGKPIESVVYRFYKITLSFL